MEHCDSGEITGSANAFLRKMVAAFFFAVVGTVPKEDMNRAIYVGSGTFYLKTTLEKMKTTKAVQETLVSATSHGIKEKELCKGGGAMLSFHLDKKGKDINVQMRYDDDFCVLHLLCLLQQLSEGPQSYRWRRSSRKSVSSSAQPSITCAKKPK